MLGYKTQTLKMLTTKKIDDYFQREWEQTAKKWVGRRISYSQNTVNDRSVRILLPKRHFVVRICKKKICVPLSQNSGSAPANLSGYVETSYKQEHKSLYVSLQQLTVTYIETMDKQEHKSL